MSFGLNNKAEITGREGDHINGYLTKDVFEWEFDTTWVEIIRNKKLLQNLAF